MVDYQLNFEKPSTNMGEEKLKLAREAYNREYKNGVIKTLFIGDMPIPVITCTNNAPDRNGGGFADSYGAEDILENADQVHKNIINMMTLSRITVIRETQDGALNIAIDDDKKESNDKRTNQLFDQDVNIIDIQTDAATEASGGSTLKVSDHELKAGEWLDLQKRNLQQYKSHVGEMIDIDANATNKHTAEIQSRGDDKFRITASKTTQRKNEIRALIELLMKYYELTLDPKNNNNIFAGVDEVGIDIDIVDARNEIYRRSIIMDLHEKQMISKQQVIRELYAQEDIASNLFFDKMQEEINNERGEIKEVEKTPFMSPEEPVNDEEVKDEEID